MAKQKFNIVKEVKQHEKKYTAILVVLFVFIIIFTGYCILSIDNKELNNNVKSINYRYTALSSSFQTITLTNKNIMSDIEGLDTNKTSIHIENNTNDKYDYKIVLKRDKATTKSCGCVEQSNDYKYIKYSLDGKNILNLDKDMVIYKGTLNKDEEKDILINIWLDKNLNIDNYHYHGYFSIEKINQD
jgi:hypothetical protein